MKITLYLLFLVAPLLWCGCIKPTTYTTDARTNFDLLWKEVDQKYGLFARKNVDWAAIRRKYEPKVGPNTDSDSLFGILRAMLSELQDGHVALLSPINVFSYRDFYLNFPSGFDPVLIERVYLGNAARYFAFGSIPTRILPHVPTPPSSRQASQSGPRILYARYASFSNPIPENALNVFGKYMKDLQIEGLILDIRDNTGGLVDQAKTFAAMFAEKSFTGAYVRFKTGYQHDAFSDFVPMSASTILNISKFTKPVALLVNRKVYSAANLFAAMMKTLPNVVLIGDKTGGGGGLPYSGHLPNGWQYNFSTTELFSSNKEPLEYGVEPHIYARLDHVLPSRAVACRTNGVCMTDRVIDTAYQVLARKIAQRQ